MKLKRYDKNPILAPVKGCPWADLCVCNPGVWYDGQNVHMLYRAAGQDAEHRIYFGHAVSANGFDFRLTDTLPCFGPSADGFDAGCVEDPRIVRFGDTYFVTYATRLFPPGQYWKPGVPLNHYQPALPGEAPVAARENITRSGLALTKDFKHWRRLGPITPADVDDRDVILFPEKVHGDFVMLHRPATWIGDGYCCEKPSIWASFSKDLMVWNQDHLLAQPHFSWESKKIGGGTPPLRTKDGWLVIYHGVDEQKVYRAGAMLLDLDDPLRIIGRAPEPILEPEALYEKNGLMPDVVFPCGNVIIGETLFVYYGGADTHVGVATINLAQLLAHLRENPWRG